MSREQVTSTAVVSLFIFLAAYSASQLYTVPDPWRPYAITIREYLDAGLRGDSTGLARRSATGQPVTWVLDVVRRQPATVAVWARHLGVTAGHRRGDTVAVALRASVKGCTSVAALLINHSAMPRLLAISSSCIHWPPPPADRP
ncbi:MAG: hypothetical protein ACREMZ_03410 [Gemmatimonadales bacterium]